MWKSPAFQRVQQSRWRHREEPLPFLLVAVRVSGKVAKGVVYGKIDSIVGLFDLWPSTSNLGYFGPL